MERQKVKKTPTRQGKDVQQTGELMFRVRFYDNKGIGDTGLHRGYQNALVCHGLL